MKSYFTIDELCRSDVAKSKNMKNSPSEEQKVWLQQLIDNVLNPIREAYGKPIHVTSGYRNPKLNKMVGGVKNSHHLCQNGYAAADITTWDKQENKKLFELIGKLDIMFAECFNEFHSTWIHISYNENDTRCQYGRLH